MVSGQWSLSGHVELVWTRGKFTSVSGAFCLPGYCNQAPPSPALPHFILYSTKLFLHPMMLS